MRNIGEVAAVLNARLGKTALGDFYALRGRLNGGRRRAGGLFQIVRGDDKPMSGYAFHEGGRTELQFNIGFEDDGHFRYGVAFSLEPGRDMPDPVSALRPKIDAFNAALSRHGQLQRLSMWSHRNRVRSRDGLRSQDGRVEAIPESLMHPGTFVFVGERVDVSESGVTEAIIDRAASVLASLLPLYEDIETSCSIAGKTRIALAHQASRATPTYVTRLAYNSQKWWRPTGAGDVHESGDSYRTANGSATRTGCSATNGYWTDGVTGLCRVSTRAGRSCCGTTGPSISGCSPCPTRATAAPLQ